MSNENSQILNKVFTSVLEQLAFMFAEPPESESPDLGTAGIVQVSMSFHGPFHGTMDLTVPRSMCEELAANVLGLDPDDEMVTRSPFDALKELLNITCGNVLTTLAGDTPVFDLSIPATEQLDAAAWDDLRTRSTTAYCLVDDFPVLLHMETSETS